MCNTQHCARTRVVKFDGRPRTGCAGLELYGLEREQWKKKRSLLLWQSTQPCRSNGEIHLIKLDHSEIEKVRDFYASLHGPVIVGLEATGYSQTSRPAERAFTSKTQRVVRQSGPGFSPALPASGASGKIALVRARRGRMPGWPSRRSLRHISSGRRRMRRTTG
jgi:hypothetical protein